MNQHSKNAAMLAIACLLLLVAGARFWSMAMDARDRAALNSYHSHINQRIISHIGPHKPDPFADLGLSEEQRRKIDDIMNANLPKLGPKLDPPKSFQGRPGEPFRGPGKNHIVRVVMPMDKILAVLTPEQRRKFDQMRAEDRKDGMGMPGGAPSPSGPSMLVIRRSGAPPGQ